MLKKIIHKLTIDNLLKVLWSIARAVILIGLCFVIIYPLIIKLVASFMSLPDLLDPTVKYFPRLPTMDNIERVMDSMDYWKTFFSTILLSSVVSLCQLAVSCLGGYGFARFKFRGKNVVFLLSMFTLLIPTQITLTPLFLTFKNFFGLNLLNTYAPFALLAATGLGFKSGLYIFIMRQYFRSLPKELEQSAYIDGAGPLKCFVKIILPNAGPMLVTVFLFSFTWQWTENIFTPLFLPQINVFSSVMTMVASMDKDNPIMFSTLINTASLLVIIPLLIVYLFMQKYFVQSMERSGLVG